MQAGANAEDIRRLLNHVSTATTTAYIHRTDDRLQALAQKVEQSALLPKVFPTGNKEAVRVPVKGGKHVH